MSMSEQPKSNLDRILQRQRERLAWLRAMFATKESRILFAVAILVAFGAGVLT